MKKRMECDICGKEIKKKGDINIRFFGGLGAQKSCDKCYLGKIKRKREYLLGYTPWRGMPFNLENNKKYLIGLIIYSLVLVFLTILYRTNYSIMPRFVSYILIVMILLICWYWAMLSEARKIVNSLK